MGFLMECQQVANHPAEYRVITPQEIG